LSSPELARLAGETEHILNIADSNPKKHHQHSASKTARQEKAVRQLKDVVVSANPFNAPENDDGSEMKLVNFVTKRIMPTAVQHDVLDIEARGSTALATYVDERV
jgi:hypothetical protein